MTSGADRPVANPPEDAGKRGSRSLLAQEQEAKFRNRAANRNQENVASMLGICSENECRS
jgi:hypothetical protein